MGHARLNKPLQDTYISPRFRVSDWTKLDLSKRSAADWERAVAIFLDRIEGRFLMPVNAIRKHTDYAVAEFSGFAVIAIDCLLIETLIQFYRGEDETTGWHGDAFAEFFLQSNNFRPHFDSKRKAHIFYGHFRCGILHQAQTKKRSLVRYGLPAMVQPIVKDTLDEGLLIDRELFHEALVKEISDYTNLLRHPAPPQRLCITGEIHPQNGIHRP